MTEPTLSDVIRVRMKFGEHEIEATGSKVFVRLCVRRFLRVIGIPHKVVPHRIRVPRDGP